MAAAPGQDAAKVAPHVYRVILENERVRVLDVRMKPGERSAMHSHPAYVVYVLGDGTVTAKLTSSDGQSAQVEMKPGDVMWREAETHSAEHLRGANLHAIFVELKK